MKKILKFGLLFGLFAMFVGNTDVFAATSKSGAKRQSALQAGTKVRAKVEAKGIYDQECYDAYYGCMDQFCIADNENGGTCTCSDESKKYESQLDEIQKILVEAERISTEEVEKVQAGANADIIFNGGERVYNADGSVVKAGEEKKSDAKVAWTSIYDEEDDEDEIWDDEDLADKTGQALYDAAHRLCKEQMPDSCSKDMKMLTQMYSRQIVSDCKGLANSIAQKKQEADAALNQAKAAVRGALKESLAESNQYGRGECMVEYKKCMKSDDACGSDWSNCVFTIASENMQNNTAVSVAGTKVETINTYDITASTMEILESKRYICERVLDKCVANRQYVWDDFLRESAPTIRLAEANVESNKRQSCLGDISNCIQKACKDDIVGKGVATMDACLARPDMARSFCKIQIDPCERMEPQIWDYVVSKLAAMRVDACTQEVKDCFTSEDRCGKDFVNCIGMDFNYIHDICPIDKLVVCKQTNPKFNMSDLDSMLMGLYLNIDNKALENCQNLAEEKMTELCGSTTDCDEFAADEYIGTSSVKSEKINGMHRIAGLITFGKIKMGDATGSVKDDGKVLLPGEIGVQDYIKEITQQNKGVKGADAIIAAISDELNNIAGSINRTISLIESDQQIQYCINGRDLSQINGRGKKNNTTEARFPNLLNQYRVMIGMAALRKAQDNYNAKWQELLSKATADASADIAEYMCYHLPSGTGNIGIAEETPLVTPYSIVYDVGQGLSQEQLTKMNASVSSVGGMSASGNSSAAGAIIGGAIGAAAGPQGLVAGAAIGGALGAASKHTSTIPGGTKTVWASFNREDRICHLCTSLSTQKCTSKKNIFRTNLECDEAKNTETCQDIKM